MSCTTVGEFCKRPPEIYKLRIPLKGSSFIKIFTADEILGVSDCRRPKKANGYEYEVTSAGQCVKSEPEWPLVIGATVDCGSVEFTCRAVSNLSLARVIQSVAWDGGTLSISNDGFVNTAGEQEVFCLASGGVVGDTGEVIASITFSDGSIEDALLSYHVD